MFNLKETVWRYHRLIAILTAVIIVNIFGLTLLHYKYDIFTGGFLQPFYYKSISERFIFIITFPIFPLTVPVPGRALRELFPAEVQASLQSP